MGRPSIWEQKQAKFLDFITGGGKNDYSSGKVYGSVSSRSTNPGASGMQQNAQPWLDCYPEPAKNPAEAADIWERYAKSTIFWVIYAPFLYKVKSPQSNLPGPH